MRKNLLLALILVFGGLLGTYLGTPDPLNILFDPERALTFEGAMALAERLDEIGDQLSALDLPPMPSNSAQLSLLTLEIVQFFYYDEIVDGDASLPPVQWAPFPSERNFHVLGSTRVIGPPSIAINIRYANSWASWYGKRSLYATMVHELAHSQGVFKFGDELSEPATQLVTVEVLAAMSRDGNAWAFPALVRELQGFADDYVLALALNEDRMDEYRAYLGRVGDGVWSEAKFERAMDHWADNMMELRLILERYGKVPYRLLIESLNSPDYMTRELLAIPNESHTFVINDTAWAIQHLLELAEEYPMLLDLWHERHE